MTNCLCFTYKWYEYLQFFRERTKNNNFWLKKNNTYAAVIVEPRKLDVFEMVLRNFMYFLSKEWTLYIFHGTENEKFVKQITKNWGQIEYVNLGKANLTQQDYNSLLTSAEFYNRIHCENILIFQCDTILRKPIPREFLDYDFVGAPWFSPGEGYLQIGNGGLSLRKKSAMLKIINQQPYEPPNNEDGYFAKNLVQLRMNTPSVQTASEFSVETIFYHDPVGIHKGFINLMPSVDSAMALLDVAYVQ